MKLNECERRILKFYLNKYNVKWMRVFNNKHPFIETTVEFFTFWGIKIKNQPIAGERTYIKMFEQLSEGRYYFIPNLLKRKEENLE